MKTITKTFLASLAVFALIIGCSGGDPNIETARLNVKNQEYDKALEAVNKAIEANEDNAYAYYYKGFIHSEQVRGVSDPAKRRDIYDSMTQAWSKAKEVGERTGETPKEMALVDLNVSTLWSREHNQAIQLVTADTVTDAKIEAAIGHLENATILEPDSTVSYDVLGEVYMMANDTTKAIETFERVSEFAPVDYNRELRIASLYGVKGENVKKIAVLRKMRTTFSDSIGVVQEMANTYLREGDTENALAVVKELIDAEPTNPQYRLVYGTQVYQAVTSKTDDLQANYDQLFDLRRELRNADDDRKKEIQTEIAGLQDNNARLETESEELTQTALEQLQKAAELAPENANVNHTIGIIYQNRAAALFEKRNASEDVKKADEFDTKAKEILKEGLGYYEKAAEIEPDNQSYWQSLFRVYTTLGMMDKAQVAMEKAGI